jgi:hypothetical protein
METDAVYFSRRAQEERVAAMKAPHPAARQAHLDMADRYEEFATAIASREQILGLDPVSAANGVR